MSRPPPRLQQPNGIQRIDKFFTPVARPNQPSCPRYWNGRPINPTSSHQQSLSLTANPSPDPPMYAKNFRGPGGPRLRQPSSDQLLPSDSSSFRQPTSSYGNQRPPQPVQPFNPTFRNALQTNRPNMPISASAGFNRAPAQAFQRTPTSTSNSRPAFQNSPRSARDTSHLMPNPSQRFTSSYQASRLAQPFPSNSSNVTSSLTSSRWQNAGGFIAPEEATSQVHSFTSSALTSQNAFQNASSASGFPTAHSFYSTGHAPSSTAGSALDQVFDVVDDDEEAGLLAALEEYESTQPAASLSSAPSVPLTIPPTSSNHDDSIQILDDDMGDVDWGEIMELEDRATCQEDAQPVAAQPKIQLPPPVVATNFAIAPHNPAFARQPSAPMLRQQTLQEVQPEPVIILDEAPKGTQVPANIKPLPGFDMEAGMTWLYPTNYPVRDYQYNIVQKALYKNTLVSLPTGLGKTFVAAVVMFNFYRWYPEGKVIFLAPTKPLVTQQHKACYQVMGIPQSDMAQMTGAKNPERRATLWATKRVFFMTPQTAVNDLDRGAFLASDVRCLVIDEAHRATGGYAYVEMVRMVASQNKNFRVLALSATPGNDLAGIQIVLTNLRINHIEIRTDESLDIRQYVHKKTTDREIVKLDPQMRGICDLMFRVISYYVDQLKKLHAISAHIQPENLSMFQMRQHSREFSAKTSATGFMKQRTTTFFMTLQSLLHAYELLCNYGMRPFYRFVHATLRDGASKHGLSRSELEKNHDFNRLVQNVKDILGEDLTLVGDLDDPANTSTPNFGRPYVYGHPKLRKLEEIVLNHFNPQKRYSEVAFEGPSTSKGPPEPFAGGSPSEDSRIMIFTTYRESVHEIAELLRRSEPLVCVMAFVGQASTTGKKGLTQKEQAEVIEKFRSGDFNVLVSTSVGEEGLDIGEVDLIICFDTQKSPIRSVQRTGRTGRKRAGRTIVLLTEGKEENNHKQCLTKKTYAAKTLLSTKYDMFKDIPRMVPEGLKPVCVQLKLENPEFEDENISGKFPRKKSSKGELQTWLRKKVKSKESEKFDHKYLSDAESLEYNRYCRALSEEVPSITVKPNLLHPRKILKSLHKLRTKEVQTYGVVDPPLSLSNYTAWQIMRQPVSGFRHSARSEDFVTTMQQLEDFTAQSSGEKELSFKDEFTKWYRKAERAGYMELDSEDDPGSSGESDGEDSRAGSPEIPFVPSAPLKRVSKRMIHPTKLCSLSTPLPFVPSPEEPQPRPSMQPPLETLEEVSHEAEEPNALVSPSEPKKSFTEKQTSKGAAEDVARKEVRRNPSEMHPSLLTEDETVIDQPQKPSLKQMEEIPVEEVKLVDEGLSQTEKDEIADLQMENWETWNEPPKQPETDKQADISMLSMNGALSFVNRTSTSSSQEARIMVQETPLIPSTKSSSQQTRPHETNNFQIAPTDFKLDFNEVVPKKITDDVFLSPLQPFTSRINDTIHPSGGGPLSHSTPRHDRTRRRLMVTPDISPVCDRTRTTASKLNRFDETREFVPRPLSPMAQPRSSVSRVEGSIGDESDLEGEDLIPCSFPDETALRAEEALFEKERKDVGMLEPTDSLDVEGLPVFDEIPPTLPFVAVEESPVREKERKRRSLESISQEVGKMKLADVPTEKGRIEVKVKGGGEVVELNKSGSENKKMEVEDSIQYITPEKVVRSKSPLKMSDLPNHSYDEVSRILIPRKKSIVAISPESAEKPCRAPRRSSGIGSSRSESSLKTPIIVKKRNRNTHLPFKSPLKKNGEVKGGRSRPVMRKPPLVKPRLRALEFIDDQAEVSGDHTCSSDEEEGDELDEDTSKLIASQMPDEDPSYMRAIYAQALHRPDPTTDEVLGRHRKKVFNHSDIFSQPFVQDDDYGSSSFVSYSDDEEESPLKRKKLARENGSKKPPKARGWKHDFQSGPENRRK